MFQSLDYIYLASANFEKDFDYYSNVLEAKLVWKFHDFGANVAAFNLCGKPYLLIADHLDAPGSRLIYRVDKLSESIKSLKDKGWKSEGERFEIPDGPCYNFSDPSGNKFAIYQAVRPAILEKEYTEHNQ
jgi:predicted enzyme related to lactoylglutathione lyase